MNNFAIPRKQLEKMAKIIAELNGTKVFVIGNHDKGRNAMYKMGFDVGIIPVGIFTANFRIDID